MSLRHLSFWPANSAWRLNTPQSSEPAAARLRREPEPIAVRSIVSRIIDPITLEELAGGETGEIVTHGPQLMQRHPLS